MRICPATSVPNSRPPLKLALLMPATRKLCEACSPKTCCPVTSTRISGHRGYSHNRDFHAAFHKGFHCLLRSRTRIPRCNRAVFGDCLSSYAHYQGSAAWTFTGSSLAAITPPAAAFRSSNAASLSRLILTMSGRTQSAKVQSTTMRIRRPQPGICSK